MKLDDVLVLMNRNISFTLYARAQSPTCHKECGVGGVTNYIKRNALLHLCDCWYGTTVINEMEWCFPTHFRNSAYEWKKTCDVTSESLARSLSLIQIPGIAGGPLPRPAFPVPLSVGAAAPPQGMVARWL